MLKQLTQLHQRYKYIICQCGFASEVCCIFNVLSAFSFIDRIYWGFFYFHHIWNILKVLVSHQIFWKIVFAQIMFFTDKKS
jgi:hypothetical protein